MWECKHYMKIGGVNDLSPAFIHPDLFVYSLAARTVTITAGIIMDLYMPTIRTLAEVIAKGSCFAVEDGMGSFRLDIRQVMILRAIIIIRMFKHLPDIILTHEPDQPGQKG